MDLAARYRGTDVKDAAEWLRTAFALYPLSVSPFSASPSSPSGEKRLFGKEAKAAAFSRPPEREHMYPGGTLKKVIWRGADGKKSAAWYHLGADGQWQTGRGEEAHRLYEQGAEFRDMNTVYIVEGEKDVDSLSALECYVVSGENGCASWLPVYTQALQGFENVLILPDNDGPGWKYAKTAAEALAPTAGRVRILDLRKAWPEIPKKKEGFPLFTGIKETSSQFRPPLLIRRGDRGEVHVQKRAG